MKTNNINNKQEWIEKAKKLAGEYAHCYAFVGDETMPMKHKELMSHLESVDFKIEESIAKPKIEPVGWTNECQLEYVKDCGEGAFWSDEEDSPILLYAEPPKHEPLSREQILQIIEGGESLDQFTLIDFAIAIEKAHGIGE